MNTCNGAKIGSVFTLFIDFITKERDKQEIHLTQQNMCKSMIKHLPNISVISGWIWTLFNKSINMEIFSTLRSSAGSVSLFVGYRPINRSV